MSMANIDDANEAYQQIINELAAYGSDNKRQGKGVHSLNPKAPGTEAAVIRFNTQKMKMQAVRTVRPVRGGSLAEVVAYGDTVLKEHVGNCFEYAAAACAVLATKRPPPVFDVVQMPTLDHAFVVIGQPGPDAQGNYPNDFGTWAAGAAICDGWAEICCLATQYPARWNLKMDNWHASGLEVAVGDKKDVGGGWKNNWGAPTEYRDQVQSDTKESYTWRRDNGCCFITTATCLALGLEDDCHDLTALRGFRDRVMRASVAGAADVDIYYAIAPAIVAAIDGRPDRLDCYEKIHDIFIAPAVAACDRGDDVTPHRIFGAALLELAQTYAPHVVADLRTQLARRATVGA
jgi:hypothetical protein